MSEEAEASILNEIANAAREGMTDGVGAHLDGDEGGDQQFEDPGTPLENEYAPQEESEDEDDIQITIGDIRSNVTFRPPPTGQRGTGGAKQTQKLDIDATANANGVPIFDLDLASLEEKPWRKPGADITDYFNYGFVEETWQIYCERQRKLRAEYGSAASANKQLFSSLTNLMPVGNLNAVEIKPIVKILPVNSSPAVNLAPPTANNFTSSAMEIPIIMRTVLTVPPVSESSTSIATVLTPAVPTPTVQPPPTNVQTVHSLAANVPTPQPVHSIQTVKSNARSQSSPPESPSITPPPDDEFSAGPLPVSSSGELTNMLPGSLAGSVPSVTTAASESLPFVDLSVPPPRFPPTNLPPPGFAPPHGIPGVPGLPPTNVPPPLFPPGPLPPPGMPIRFPPPFGFPPPGAPRLPPFRDGYAGFSQMPREEVRSPASYSDKSSDDDRERYERHRRSRGDHYRRSHSRSHRHGSRERQSSRHGRHHSRASKERERSFYRGGGGGGGPGEDREHYDEHKRPRERSETRERSKMRKIEDEELQKIKKRKIKEEIPDEDELMEKDVSRKKSKERSTDHKERSSASKKRKKTKDRHDEDDGEPNS